LIITEIQWLWVVPAYLPLEVFIFGKGSGMVSYLAKRLKYQLLQGQGETIVLKENYFFSMRFHRTVLCLDSLDSLDRLDMFICCTGIRLLVEE
jgi:hypothetical protein